MKLITETKALNAAIDSIARRGPKLDQDINRAAVSAMAHHDKHGDVTVINRLVEAMPKGSRVNALREFIMKHGKVTYNEETKVFEHDKSGSFDLEGALEKPWTEYKPEKPYQPFNATKAIEKIVKRLDKVDPAKGDKCTAKEAAAIKKLAAELGVEV